VERVHRGRLISEHFSLNPVKHNATIAPFSVVSHVGVVVRDRLSKRPNFTALREEEIVSVGTLNII
jgi:hypothetical protein